MKPVPDQVTKPHHGAGFGLKLLSGMALSMLQCKRLTQGKGSKPMVEIVRTNDLVVIGFLQSLLEDANIHVLVADMHVSAIEGMMGAFPKRILVLQDDVNQARRLIRDAGLGAELLHA
jgi:hypothetical protein